MQKKFIYTPDGEFEVLYFKVKQTVGEEFAESESAAAYYPIDWEDETDTDNDGLTDVYEKYYFETDPTNPDTDGDGLPDGYEVYYLGTDPKKADTDDNGISDGDEDFDKDGLSNLREYELSTDPNNADSDSDGLNDGEEVNKYNTDPLKIDTDDDGITDKDEIDLGLDPTNASTDGIPDNERTFEQSVGAETENFASVNTDENPFKVSVDVTAAGVAANNLYADESGYSAFVSNEAILGITPEFFYNDKLKVEKITINFDVDSNYVANTSGKYVSVSDEFVGIKRFNVFKYFDDINMLLPIETFHDVANNRVYANVDEMGTYCLIDMEIWFEKLGIEPKAAEPQAMFNNTDENNLDVIFVVYSNATFYKYLKAELTTAVTDIFNEAEKRDINARVHFVTWTGGMYTNTNTNTGTHYAENIDDAVLMINNTPVIDVSLEPTVYMLTKAVNGIKNNMTEDFLEDSKKYCFVIDSGCNPACSTINGGIDTLKERGMDFSFVYAPGCTNINNYAALSSNNSIHQMVVGNGRLAFGEFVFEHIFDEEEEIIIKSNDFERLPSDFGEISSTSTQDYDDDGVLDVEEIDWEAINNYLGTAYSLRKSSVDLPKYKTFVSNKNTNFSFSRYNSNIDKDMNEVAILAVQSDPTRTDTDRDGFDDRYEYLYGKKYNLNVEHHDNTKIIDETIDDSFAFDTSGKMPSNDIFYYDDCKGVRLSKSFIKAGEDSIESNSDYIKNILEYTRNNYSKAKYVLKPKESSDYTIKLIVPQNSNATIAIEEMSYLLFIPTYDPINAENIIKRKTYTLGNGSKCIETTVALNSGTEYCIMVNGLDENQKNEEYALTFEQDNWIYAPYGGIFYNPKYTSTFLGRNATDYEEYTKIYFTDYTLVSMMTYYSPKYIIDNRFIDKDAYQMALHDHVAKFWYTDEEILGLDSITDIDKANIVSIVSTYFGAGLGFFPKLNVLAGFVTATGVGSTTYVLLFDSATSYDSFKSILDKAVYSEKFDYRLVYKTYHMKDAEPNAFVNISADVVKWNNWNIDMNYINKYDEYLPKLRSDVTPFTYKDIIPLIETD